MILPISVSEAAEIAGVSHWHGAWLERLLNSSDALLHRYFVGVSNFMFPLMFKNLHAIDI
jgi:hypothetical protein